MLGIKSSNKVISERQIHNYTLFYVHNVFSIITCIMNYYLIVITLEKLISKNSVIYVDYKYTSVW